MAKVSMSDLDKLASLLREVQSENKTLADALKEAYTVGSESGYSNGWGIGFQEGRTEREFERLSAEL